VRAEVRGHLAVGHPASPVVDCLHDGVGTGAHFAGFSAARVGFSVSISAKVTIHRAGPIDIPTTELTPTLVFVDQFVGRGLDVRLVHVRGL
jgi:hypothetical protein